MTVHQVARTYGQSPEAVRGWPWLEVQRAQILASAEAEAQETVRKHDEAMSQRR